MIAVARVGELPRPPSELVVPPLDPPGILWEVATAVSMVGVKEDPSDVGGVRVGDRVSVGGDRGTVRFVGPVSRAAGTWVGVEWDSPGRGRHDGVHAGVRYFQAPPGSASLVRLERLELSRSLPDAIKDRYGSPDQLSEEELHLVCKATGAPFIEMVGFDKVVAEQEFSSLRIVSAREEKVSGPGRPGELAALIPAAQELDLGRNLIKNWLDVAAIGLQLPKLRTLDISENRLAIPNEPEALKQAFLNLDYLVMSRLDYDWDAIMKCSVMWPAVVKLQISYNKISRLSPPPPDILSNLTLLSLEGNQLESWNDVLCLGSLSKLQILNLSHTGICEVYFPSPNKCFPALKYLLLSGNRISEWTSVNELNKLASLKELRFRDNPVMDRLTIETAMQILIARLPSVILLNGQDITPEERRGAEVDYLKQEAKGWHESKSDPEMRLKFLRLNPLYPTIVNKYGEIDRSEFEKKSSALKHNMAKVQIECDGRVVERQLPLMMSVQKLCVLLNRTFNRHVEPRDLILISQMNAEHQVLLMDEMKSLSFYSIESGDKIVVLPHKI